MAGRHEPTAAEWVRIAPLLPARETRGRYYADHLRVLNGMLYRHATGCAWRDLPERYGPWSTVSSRQRRWRREGLWNIHNDFIPANVLMQDRVVTAVLDFEFVQVDVRVVDLANSLRNLVRLWEAGEPWERIERCCEGYTDRIRQSDSERGAIPMLMRLRNAWRVLRLLRRPRVVGTVHPAIQQLEHAQQFVTWLAEQEKQLLGTIRAGLR